MRNLLAPDTYKESVVDVSFSSTGMCLRQGSVGRQKCDVISNFTDLPCLSTDLVAPSTIRADCYWSLPCSVGRGRSASAVRQEKRHCLSALHEKTANQQQSQDNRYKDNV
jgi:hypothetical protein